jgi:hypothetical protein
VLAEAVRAKTPETLAVVAMVEMTFFFLFYHPIIKNDESIILYK